MPPSAAHLALAAALRHPPPTPPAPAAPAPTAPAPSASAPTEPAPGPDAPPPHAAALPPAPTPTPRAPRAVLLSVRPPFARLIEIGRKRVEFRRRFPAGPWDSALRAPRAALAPLDTGPAALAVLFYVTSPVRAIALRATVAAVHRAAPAALWRRFASEGGVDRPAFDAYFAGAPSGVALVLTDVRPLPHPLTAADLRRLNLRPPQSARLLPPTSPLATELAHHLT